VGMRGGADGGSVGLSSLGPTFPVGAGSFRALRNRDRPKAQEPHRMGRPASHVGEALVPTTRDSSRSRQHLRFLEAPRPMSGALQSDHLHHPPAPRCRPLRASPTTLSWSIRTTSPQRRSTCEPLRCGRESRSRVGTDHDHRLVRCSTAHRGGDLGNGGLVQHGLARCAAALGFDP
jgi:hypothetical protein